MNKQGTQKNANIVLIAGVIFNLTTFVIYSWSIFKSNLTAPIAEGGWAWSSSEAGLPYSIAAICLAIGSVIGGHIQDKLGPRLVVTSGAVLVGFGMMLSGIVGNSVIGITICYGVITGLGIGFGYISVLSTALKWFSPGKKGFVTGFLAGALGLSAVIHSPVATMLLSNFGIKNAFLYLGIGILIIGTLATVFIKLPPAGYIPPETKSTKRSEFKIEAKTAAVDFTWREMIKTRRFFLISVMLLFSASVGLMVVGNVTKIATIQAGITDAQILALLVSFMAIMNGCGRISGGIISDKLGRANTLAIVFLLQMSNMAGFMFYKNTATILVGIIIAGLCYGTACAVIPALAADQFGLKNFGVNFGIINLFWGIAGLVVPVVADYFYDLNGNFNTAYIICAVIMAMMICVSFLFKKDISKSKLTSPIAEGG